MNLVARSVWLLTGLAWAGGSLLSFAHPAYWAPVTAIDWIAVWSFSTCWLLLAPSILLLGVGTRFRPAIIAAGVVAFGAAAAGVANAVEDGLGIKVMGTAYVLGALTAGFGLLPLAAMVSKAGFPRLAGVIAVLFVGVLAFVAGGGVLVLGALGSLAVTPGWFASQTQGSQAAGTPAA